MQIWLGLRRLKGSNWPQIKAIFLRQLPISPISDPDQTSWSNLHNADKNDKIPHTFYELVTRGGDSHENSF